MPWITALLLSLSCLAVTPVRAADELETYQQRLVQLFHQLDINGDGRLDRLEASANPYLKRHFNRLDRGDRGFLVPGDLR